MLSQLADIPDVLFLGGSPIIFKLDVLLELGDRRIVCYMHRPGGCSRVRATSRLIDQPMNGALLSPCRAAAQFNETVERWRIPRVWHAERAWPAALHHES